MDDFFYQELSILYHALPTGAHWLRDYGRLTNISVRSGTMRAWAGSLAIKTATAVKGTLRWQIPTIQAMT